MNCTPNDSESDNRLAAWLAGKVADGYLTYDGTTNGIAVYRIVKPLDD